MGLGNSLLIIGTIIAISGAAFADEASTPLSPVALFTRCYSQLTQQRLPLSHPLRAQVAAGTIAPVAACMQIAKEGLLIGPGQANEGTLINDTPEARAVLRTMNDLHRSWFASDRLIPAVTGEYAPFSQYLYDETESALFVTRALFYPSVPYSDVVTDQNDMEAIRDLKGAAYPNPYGMVFALSAVGEVNGSAYHDVTIGGPIPYTPTQRGQLKGVISYADDPDQTKLNYTVNNSGFTFSYVGAPNTNTTPHKPMGGGLMGTSSFILLNQFSGNWTDGGLYMNRVWSRAVFNSLMCRDVPVIRLTDATPFVEPSPQPQVPFRAQNQCMQCHASMDPMAGVLRNNFIRMPNAIYNSAGALINTPAIGIYQFPVSYPPVVGQTDSDGWFFERPPQGHFMFRSYDGTLLQANLNNINDLGTALAGSNDLYACAASRYLNFFTGVNVNWVDIGDPSVTNSSQIAADPYRTFAVQLGQQLKQNQSLMQVIQTIFQSSLYQSNSMQSAP
jgi:hypothetical protein